MAIRIDVISIISFLNLDISFQYTFFTRLLWFNLDLLTSNYHFQEASWVQVGSRKAGMGCRLVGR